MTSPTSASAERPAASGEGFFSPARISGRSTKIRGFVEEGAPVANEVFKTVVTGALSNSPHPAAQISASAAGVVAGESAESTSRMVSEALVIPAMEAAERGSGHIKEKVDKLC